MRRWLIVLALIGLVIASIGCAQPAKQPYIPYTPAPAPAPDGTRSVETYREPPADVTWISPGKVMIGNYYPGARAEWELQVHNGNDKVAMFAIAYRYPDRVEAGYAYPPVSAPEWIIIADPTPVLMPKETRAILIAVVLPEDILITSPDWEFWISVKDTTQSGTVQTELCSRWLVSMRT